MKTALRRVLAVLLPIHKPVRYIFEAKLRQAARGLAPGTRVLDFASAGNKYRCFFGGCFYVGGDVDPHPGFDPTDPDTHFVRADFNHNPFARGYFDVVVTTNSINYASEEVGGIRNAFDSLVENLKPDGTFVTAATLTWPHAETYLDWIDETFETVRKTRYDGAVTYWLRVVHERFVHRARNRAERAICEIAIRVVSTICYPALRFVGDVYPQGFRHAVFVVAEKKRTRPCAEDGSAGSWPFLKSPLDGSPLVIAQGAEEALARAALERESGDGPVDSVLTDGRLCYAVRCGVPDLLMQNAVAVPASTKSRTG